MQFLGLKNNGKHSTINSVVGAMEQSVANVEILTNIEEIVRGFARQPMSTLIYLHCWYHQTVLHEAHWDGIDNHTTQGMWGQTTLVQEATHSVLECVSVSRSMQ